MTTDADTLPDPSSDEREQAQLSLEALLLAGLTAKVDETPALSTLSDATREIQALTDLLGLDLRGQPLERDAMIVLLDGVTSRLSTGVELMRRELTTAKEPS